MNIKTKINYYDIAASFTRCGIGHYECVGFGPKATVRRHHELGYYLLIDGYGQYSHRKTGQPRFFAVLEQAKLQYARIAHKLPIIEIEADFIETFDDDTVKLIEAKTCLQIAAYSGPVIEENLVPDISPILTSVKKSRKSRK